jgi:hypothetical protein
MGLVKEKYDFGFVEIAHFGQLFKQFAEQPKQKCEVKPGGVDQLVRRQHVDDATPTGIGSHEIVNVEYRFAKELVTALGLNLYQPALSGANAGSADVAVICSEAGSVVCDHGMQVFQVEQ